MQANRSIIGANSRQTESSNAIRAGPDTVEEFTHKAYSAVKSRSEVWEAKRDEKRTRAISTSIHLDIDLYGQSRRLGGLRRAAQLRRS